MTDLERLERIRDRLQAVVEQLEELLERAKANETTACERESDA